MYTVSQKSILDVFMRESSSACVLAIANLSVRPSVCHTGGSGKNGSS